MASFEESVTRVCRCVLHVLCASLVATVALAQPRQMIYGGDTPQAVVAALQQAMKADNFAAAMPFISPIGRRALASESISNLLMFFAFADPKDAMSGSKPLPKAELEAQRKAYRTAVDTARRTLKPHGLDKVMGRPPMAQETQQTIDTAVAKADTVTLVASLMSLMDRFGPMLGMQRGDKPKLPFTLGNVTNYRIDGDRATARAARETLEFERIDARWYIRLLAPSTTRQR